MAAAKKEPEAAGAHVPVKGAEAGTDGWRTRVIARSLDAAMQRSLDRAQAFIAAARGLLKETGEAFTVEQVSERAGFSTRMFYQHFTSKSDLLLAVLEEEIRNGADYFARTIADETDPVKCLEVLLQRFVEVEADTRNLALLRHELELVVSHPEHVAHTQKPLTDLLRSVIERGVESGAFTVQSIDAATHLVFSLKRAYNHSLMLGNEIGVPLPSTDEFVGFCLKALGAE